MTAAWDRLRVALYARVSSERQATQQTIASQIAAVAERIRQDGFALLPENTFLDDGFSGATLCRPALERLRDRAAAGQLDRLYVLEPDRLARSFAAQAVLLDEFARHGVEVVFVNRPLGPTAEDQLLLQLQGIWAEYEREKIRERSRRGRRHRAQCGQVSVLGHAPYGYRYVPATKDTPAHYDVILERAAVVRQIFAWVGLERRSLREVIRRLFRQGVPSPAGRSHWSPFGVYAVLTNAAYQGVAEFGKTRVGPRRPRPRPYRQRPEHPRQPAGRYTTAAAERIGIAVPALVSEELFAAVAEQLAENRRRARRRARGAGALLAGLVACQVCGYACCRRGYRKNDKAYLYYRCGGSIKTEHHGAAVCGVKAARADALEEAVWQDVRALLADPERVTREYQRRQQEQDGEETAAAQAVAGRRRRLEQSVQRLIDAYTEGWVEKEEFEPRLRGLRERLSRLAEEEKQAAAAAAEEATLRLVVGRLEEFAEAVKAQLGEVTWQTKREIIRTLVKVIEVSPMEVRVVYRVPALPFVERPNGGVLQHCQGSLSCKVGPELLSMRPCPIPISLDAVGVV
jgi:site-specific DNA recombinase